ncbi:alkene reductase [Legionella sp. W05-934-2]|jgi:2,4-dienoyl-CoA reductase-like NADH-dependent reductase (Old Yellow Enzyme family)|uniref:alkene reductase n=1 Tax=Legionella sp. W05-934-2 TaxID=1198649 RepID=UPI003463787B
MKLLEPCQLNHLITLKNHIVMAPMTRNMADDHLVPTQAMADYYARRAGAGLVITEGTIIRPDGRGYSNTPGIYSQDQIAGWKTVTDQVHAQGGLIFCQIWHVGRVSHPLFLNGDLPLGPSETTMSGKIKRAEGLYYGKNRALSIQEILGLVTAYAKAAQNARDAGFDGVEIHAANGYLIDQFLHHATNLRTDNYGQTAENMAKFAVDIVKACGEAIGFERVGIRLSPAAYLNEIEEDHRDEAVFVALLNALNKLPIAYVHTGNFDDSLNYSSIGGRTMTSFMRQHYQGKLVACGSYAIEKAEQGIQQNAFDCVAIGRRFIANPNLVEKIQKGLDLIDYSPDMLTSLN